MKNKNNNNIIKKKKVKKDNINNKLKYYKNIIKKLKENNKKLYKKNINLKNEFYKILADTQNLKKRLKKEYETLKKYKIKDFVLKILPFIDNLERVINNKDILKKNALKNEKILKKGIKIIYNQIINIFKNEGIVQINSLNKKFDPTFHHAIMSIKKKKVKSNFVVEELQKGYLFYDIVLRPSLVKISK